MFLGGNQWPISRNAEMKTTLTCYDSIMRKDNFAPAQKL